MVWPHFSPFQVIFLSVCKDIFYYLSFSSAPLIAIISSSQLASSPYFLFFSIEFGLFLRQISSIHSEKIFFIFKFYGQGSILQNFLGQFVLVFIPPASLLDKGDSYPENFSFLTSNRFQFARFGPQIKKNRFFFKFFLDCPCPTVGQFWPLGCRINSTLTIFSAQTNLTQWEYISPISWGNSG